MLQTLFLALMTVECVVFGATEGKDSCNFSTAAVFSEEMVTLTWPDVPHAAAYNVYTDLGNGPMKANFSPVHAQNRFSLLWMDSAGKKERVVKGRRLSLWAVPLFSKVNGKDTNYTEGPRSCPVTNSYFRGFANVLDSQTCYRILQPRQTTVKIVSSVVPRAKRAMFLANYTRLARDIDSFYKSKIDPRDEGACVPFSTMVAKYFSAAGIPCCRAQGQFIDAFHSFNLVVIDSVEYILDFTADQFVPASAPVFIPRDFCFVDSCGEPTRSPAGTFTKMYRIETVFASDQIGFTDTPKARQYQRVLDSLEARRK